MRPRASLIACLAVLGAPLAGAAETGADPAGASAPFAGGTVYRLSAGTGTDTLAVPPGNRRVCTTRAPLFVGSLVLRQLGPPVSADPAAERPPGGRELQLGLDYTVDEDTGCVELFRSASDTLHLVATYRYLPLSGALRHRLHVPHPIDVTGAPVTAPLRPGESESDAGRLVVGGSKTFVVEVGSNRDATLRQSLDLTLRGRVTRDVELSAVLSDRDSPVTPEGTSSELEELDKIFIQLTTRNAEATFGDIEVSQTRGEFARYDRRLEGAMARRTGEHVELSGLAANARGLFRSVELFGEEGKQGPYRLAEVTGGAASGIVPGSEDVYVDGERLERGQDRDYVIDYALGEITFTPRRPMTFDSRITFDFEEETEDYSRRFTGAESAYRDGDRLSVRGVVIAESDDRSSPRGFALGDEERSLLESLGDEPPVGDAVASRFVGAGNGDYVVVAADSLAPEHFEWVGEGLGDHVVSFVFVGDGLGAYADSLLADGMAIYRFVGVGGGDFEPGRRLASPERRAVGDFMLEWRDERVELTGEIAGSSHDLNTFSTIDDSDNEDLAGKGELRLRGPEWANGKGGLRLSARWRHIGRDFSSFSRLTTPFDFLQWNYGAGALTEGEDRRLATLELSPGAGGTVTLEGGTLESGDVFSADRAAIGYARGGRLRTNARWEKTWTTSLGSRGLREVRRAEASFLMELLVPTLRARSELNRTSGDTTFTGNRFTELGAEVRVTPPGPLAIVVDFSRRLDDRRTRRRGDEWDRASKTRDRGARLDLARFGGMAGSVEYRRRTVESRLGASQKTNLARLNLEATPGQGAGRVLLDYQVTTEAVFPREKLITFVGDGRGNYDSLGVFVGTGDYDVSIVQSDETELLSRLDLAVRASFEGRATPDAPWIMRNLRASSFARVRQSTRRPFEDLVNPFEGQLYSTDRQTVDGSLTLRQEATLLPSGVVSPRVRWERSRFLDGRFDNVRDSSEEDVVSLRVRTTPAPGWTFEVEGATEERAEIVERLEPTMVRDEETFSTRRGALDVSQKPSPDWTLSIGGVLTRTTRPEVETPERRRELIPKVAWTPGRAGRIEAQVRWVVVEDPLIRRRPAFDFGLATTSGTEWSVLSDYRLKEYMTLAGTLRAVRPSGEETIFDGRIELRAFF